VKHTISDALAKRLFVEHTAQEGYSFEGLASILREADVSSPESQIRCLLQVWNGLGGKYERRAAQCAVIFAIDLATMRADRRTLAGALGDLLTAGDE